MTGPKRHSVALPTDGGFPRVGKIRLGTAEPTGKKTEWGQAIVRPKRSDHFVVAPDESGITTTEAANAFAAVYGREPTQLRCLLPGDKPEDVMEGAWRQYGANKLKIRCDGEECSERTKTGWAEKPCICKSLGLSEDDNKHCQLTFTLQVILPDVAGVGVWQIDTGSSITARRVAKWLDMMHKLRGTLVLLEFDLRLIPVSVQPAGFEKTSTVYVLDPRAQAATPAQMLAGDEKRVLQGARLAELPAPAADEAPEPTLDRTGFAESRSASSNPEGAAHTPDGDDVHTSSGAPGGTEPPSIADQIRGLGERDKKRLRERRGAWRIQPSEPDGEPQPVPATVAATAAFIETAYPDHSDVLKLLDELDQIERAKAAEQGKLV
jgi:recombination directionality factor gp3-like protein